MRPNNPNKRLRGRNRSKNSNPLARSYESNGPDVKIRGSALQVADKYSQLARDAQSAGDRVMAENYFQHAEHYYRIVAQAYEQSNQQQPRERRDDDRRNDQPNINGYDGVDDEDEGVRRTVRANGSDRHNADSDDDRGQDGSEDGNSTVSVIVHDASAGSDDSGQDETSAADAEQAPPKPTRRRRSAAEKKAEEAAAATDDESGSDEEKPKRRPRTRRTRRTTEGDAPVAETAESTS